MEGSLLSLYNMCFLYVACHLLRVVHFDLSCPVSCNGAERFVRMPYVEGEPMVLRGDHDEGLEDALCC